MVVETHVSEAAFRRVALRDPEGHWELHNGQLREKPPMSAEHNDLTFHLGFMLQRQLPRDRYRLRVNASRAQSAPGVTYIPDVAVVPSDDEQKQRGLILEVYAHPLPLVVEVWSPSTGSYDIDAKLPAYQTRGDQEIWRVHPFERTVTVWRRQPDGTYQKTVHAEGSITVASLPSVTIELAELFEE